MYTLDEVKAECNVSFWWGVAAGAGGLVIAELFIFGWAFTQTSINQWLLPIY